MRPAPTQRPRLASPAFPIWPATRSGIITTRLILRTAPNPCSKTSERSFGVAAHRPFYRNESRCSADQRLEPGLSAPWLEHIEGDVHQPLHCVSRMLKSMPKGDAGGNFVYMTGPAEISIRCGTAPPGRDDSEAYAAKYIAAATAAHPAARRQEKNQPSGSMKGMSSPSATSTLSDLKPVPARSPLRCRPATKPTRPRSPSSELRLPVTGSPPC